jgi:putative transposase
MIDRISKDKPLTKIDLAKQQGISISSLYYKPKLPEKDQLLKNQIEHILSQHPSYGHRRMAIELKINKKKIRRVMRLYDIKPYRRRGRRFRKIKDYSLIYPNLLQSIPFPEKANQVWVSDFTYISFHSKYVYLATILDIFNRKIVGWSLLTTHSVQLTLAALIDSIEKYGRPNILHSDQGSEYKSKLYIGFAKDLGIQISMSHKGCPWENGYQESFYDKFKIDLGDSNRFKTIGELSAYIYQQIYYYNNQRIHSKLKMPPNQYDQMRQLLTINSLSARL